jgi:hypothetical protein
MLRAFIDDSARGDPDLFVLAGYVSTVEGWEAFGREWQRVLDMRSPHYRQLEYFKMTEMSSPADRERCAWFHKVIEDHALAAISVTISTKELRRQVNRMVHDPSLAEKLYNPWHYAVASLIWNYAKFKPKALPDGPVKFIFDRAITERRMVWEAWEGFLAANAEYAHVMGSLPRFEDDKDFPPLQAADLLAWWVRHWQLDGPKAKGIYKCEFPWPRTRPDMPWTHVDISRPHIRAKIREIRTLRGGFCAGTVKPKLWLP